MGSQLRLDSGAADTGQGSPRIAFALLTAGAPSDFRKMQLSAEKCVCQDDGEFLQFDRWTYYLLGKCP